jgi:cytochrome c oxidase assembly protein Cox11
MPVFFYIDPDFADDPKVRWESMLHRRYQLPTSAYRVFVALRARAVGSQWSVLGCLHAS